MKPSLIIKISVLVLFVALWGVLSIARKFDIDVSKQKETEIESAIEQAKSIIEDIKNQDKDVDVSFLKLPEKFSAKVFASGLGAARDMEFGPSGELLVSILDKGRILALPNRNSDWMADAVVVAAENLNRPHGIAQRCDQACDLYIAMRSRYMNGTHKN